MTKNVIINFYVKMEFFLKKSFRNLGLRIFFRPPKLGARSQPMLGYYRRIKPV